MALCETKTLPPRVILIAWDRIVKSWKNGRPTSKGYLRILQEAGLEHPRRVAGGI